MASSTAININHFFHYQGLDVAIWEDMTIREAAQIAEASYEIVTPDVSDKVAKTNGLIKMILPKGWEFSQVQGRFLAREDENKETSPAFFGRLFIHPLGKKAIISFAGLQRTADLFIC